MMVMARTDNTNKSEVMVLDPPKGSEWNESGAQQKAREDTKTEARRLRLVTEKIIVGNQI
jgi:hypothetical protein